MRTRSVTVPDDIGGWEGLASAALARPFLKWAGGKRRLVPEILKRMPPVIDGYFEPFLGGGAVFFAMAGRYRSAHLSDANAELVNAWEWVQGDVEVVVKVLRRMRNDADYFARVRARASTPDPQGAARTIYLNKTCFNGLYRVNAKGQFNAPFGRYADPTVCDADNLRACSLALQGVGLSAVDFQVASDHAGPGDCVYFDPPYMPLTPTSNFTAFTPGGFGEEAHGWLANTFDGCAKRGVHVVLSNSDTPLVRRLYKGCRIEVVHARRNINCDASKRGEVRELLITPKGQRP